MSGIDELWLYSVCYHSTYSLQFLIDIASSTEGCHAPWLLISLGPRKWLCSPVGILAVVDDITWLYSRNVIWTGGMLRTAQILHSSAVFMTDSILTKIVNRKKSLQQEIKKKTFTFRT